MKTNIFLIGMMGSGKSTIGNLLSQKLDIPFFDTDIEIEKIMDMSIDKIFNEFGENRFRMIESVFFNECIKADYYVYATGGGIVENTLRVVDDDYDININWDTWEINNIFKLIMKKGNVPISDMRRTFNLGIGLILIINENHLDDLKSHLSIFNEECIVIGDVVAN